MTSSEVRSQRHLSKNLVLNIPRNDEIEHFHFQDEKKEVIVRIARI